MMHLLELFSVVYYLGPPLIKNIVIFGENYPFWLNFRTTSWKLDDMSLFFSVLVNISVILRPIEFIFVALLSALLAGQLGIKIILPPNFGAPLLFYLRDFTSFLDGI